MPEQYKMVAENPQSTVVSDFEPVYRKSTQYQSEAEMEHDFISQLEKQGYEYLPIKTEKELICNLRRQLECLNDYKFTDNEWQSFLRQDCQPQLRHCGKDYHHTRGLHSVADAR